MEGKLYKFPKHKNFCLDVSNWGLAKVQDITNLLDFVIIDFYSSLDSSKITILPVSVFNSLSKNPPTNCPEIIIGKDKALIYLTAMDNDYCKYSYEFSHELCHYIICKDYPPKNDKFGWLEESLCELASFYTLNKMSITWQTNPPYPNWRDFSINLKNYVNDIILMPENDITKPFIMWLKDNFPSLYKCRYDREKNRIIAIHLLPIFTRAPELWKIIQYMKIIDIIDTMTLEQYLFEWKKLIPSILYSSFDIMVSLLVGNQV